MNDNTLKIDSLLKNSEYRVIRVLGQGGFGITYEAEQVSLGRKVAVKEFFMKEYCDRDGDTSIVSVPSEGSRELVARFRAKFVKEARLIASLNNQRIIKIHDVFEENGTAYYVMDYLPGGSVSDLLSKTGDLSLNTALKYTRQIGEALDYIHSRPDPLNHLDVKPSNIMLDDNGDAVLVDFGLSKRYDSGGHQTSSTPVGVSHGYAPLEQYKEGGVQEFSPTTDIYSLGATLYKMLTGVTPPQASDVNEDGLPALPEFIPANVRSAIEKAMQPRKKDRPQSVKEFLGMLDVDGPVPAVEDEPTEETQVAGKGAAPQQPVKEPKKKSEPKPASKKSVEPKPAVKPASSAESGGGNDGGKKPGKAKGIIAAFAGGLVLAVALLALLGKCGQDKPEAPAEPVVELSDSTEVAISIDSRPTANETPTASEQPVSAMPEQPKTGSLKLTSTPSGASIWIDGKNTGRKTPSTIADLSIGSHNVVVKSSGYEDGTATVIISAGSRMDKDLQLKKKEEISQTEPAYTPAEMNKIGDDYYFGRNGKQKDYGQAVAWFRKAAEQGGAAGQNSLGVCYELGQGVAQDYTQAVSWYRKSAEQGNSDAQCNLGTCYSRGLGVSQDHTQAVSWYRKSAEQGDARGQSFLGGCYERGHGVTQDYTQAVTWYRKAAEQGDAGAQNNLGYCYANGKGVTQDYSQAVSWFRKSAEQGNASAQNNLGYCYEKGNGVEKNIEQAAELYKKSARKGNKQAIAACKRLGISY